jgi:hypothetical protein
MLQHEAVKLHVSLVKLVLQLLQMSCTSSLLFQLFQKVQLRGIHARLCCCRKPMFSVPILILPQCRPANHANPFMLLHTAFTFHAACRTCGSCARNLASRYQPSKVSTAALCSAHMTCSHPELLLQSPQKAGKLAEPQRPQLLLQELHSCTAALQAMAWAVGLAAMAAAALVVWLAAVAAALVAAAVAAHGCGMMRTNRRLGSGRRAQMRRMSGSLPQRSLVSYIFNLVCYAVLSWHGAAAEPR